jgi:hypothetical protein
VAEILAVEVGNKFESIATGTSVGILVTVVEIAIRFDEVGQRWDTWVTYDEKYKSGGGNRSVISGRNFIKNLRDGLFAYVGQDDEI